jgi:RHS repeat-associated protein
LRRHGELPVAKTVLRNPALFSVSGDPTSTTNYTYSIENGFQRTDIAIASLGQSIAASRTYDRNGRLLKTTQHMGGQPGHDVTAQYRYDEQGKVVDVIDSYANTISATYDDLGRKLSMSDPDKGDSSYKWDGLGHLLQSIDAKSQESDYTYDASGRRRSRTVNGTQVASWNYDDPTGTLISSSGDEDGYLRTYTYDALLRPTKVTTHIAGSTTWAARDFSVQYAYDGRYGREKEMQYPSGELVAYDYDPRGFAKGESQVGLTGTRTVTYRAVDLTQPHRIRQQQLGNGVSELVVTDETSGLVQFMRASAGQAPASPGALVHCTDAAAATIRCTDYSYDGLANLASQTKRFYPVVNSAISTVYGSATESYQYDELQRLTLESRTYANFTPAAGTAQMETYSYNDIGNIMAKSDFGAPYAYGNQHRPSGAGPHAVLTVGSPAVWSYQYDLNGNMKNDGQRTIGYDDQDRPNKITLGGVTTIFKYSPDGERYLQRTTSPDTSINRTIYYVDKLYERVDWDSKPNEERTYCGPSMVVEQKGATREVRYLHLDRLGSTDAATGNGGTELLDDSHGFDAYGRTRGRDWQPSADQMHPNGEWGTTTNHGFTGHEQLDETFLTHMNGRVYDYRLGRFLTVDPVIGDPANSQSINPYSYVGNNPLNLIDPTGYSACDPDTSSAFSQCENHTMNGPGPFNVAATNQKEMAKNGSSTTCGGAPANSSNAPTVVNGVSQVSTKAAANTTDAPTSAATLEPRTRSWLDRAEYFAKRLLGGSDDHTFVLGELPGGTHSWFPGLGPVTIFAAPDGDPLLAATATSNSRDDLPDGLRKFGVTATIPFTAAGAAEIVGLRLGATALTAEIAAGSPKEMLGQALGVITKMSGDAAEKAATFESLAGQISALSKGSWNAVRMGGADGSHIFSGTLGQALVISPEGVVFRGSMSLPAGNFGIGTGGKLLPLYDTLKVVK